MSPMRPHEDRDAPANNSDSLDQSVRLQRRLTRAGVRGADVRTAVGRDEASHQIHGARVRAINDLPHDVELPADLALEQIDHLGEEVLEKLALLKKHSRIQMVVSGVAATMVPIVGGIGSHILGYDEENAMKNLDASIEALCRAAADCGVNASYLEKAGKGLERPLSKRSWFVSLFIPIARTFHRAIQEGKYDQVESGVKNIVSAAKRKAQERRRGA